MPKISQMPVGAAVTGTEQLAAVQGSVTKQITPNQLATYIGPASLGYYNVVTYGAVGDGSTNDTVAIQAAIDAAGAAGGGVVYFPPATYVIQPATISTVYALIITRSKIHLMGAGREISKLEFRLYNGGDPETTVPPPLVAGAVQRGKGIYISSSLEDITTFKISGLEIDGGAGHTPQAPHGSGHAPADPVTGDGWDITHQALSAPANAHIAEYIVKDCYIHRWRGELVYYGGGELASIHIIDTKLGDSNASIISVSASDMVVRGCEVYTGYQGVENVYTNGINVYHDNYLHDLDNGGFHVFPSTSSTQGFAEIYNNRVQNSLLAVYMPGGRNMRVHGNLFVDCPGKAINITSPGGGGSGTDNMNVQNVEVFNNTAVIDAPASAIDAIVGITAADASYKPKYMHIHDNFAASSPQAVTGGDFIRRSVLSNESIGPPLYDVGVRIERNWAMDGTQDDHSETMIMPFTPVNPTETLFASLLSRMNSGVVRVFLSWKVRANCNFRIRAHFRDYSAAVLDQDIVNAAQVATTHTTMLFEAALDPDAGFLQLYYTVDTANAIRLQCEITEYSG